jgi:hypothetical protein
MTGATSETGTAYPSGAPEFSSSFIGVSIDKYAKRIRHKLNKLMKSFPIYNKLQHYLIEHACI